MCYKCEKNNHFGKMCRNMYIQKKEQERIKDRDIIDEINEPSDWINTNGPFIKPSREDKIFVDLKNLKENVDRERYISCLQCMTLFTY